MLQQHTLPIEKIRVPAKRKRTLEADKVEALATDMLENGQKHAINCRVDPKEDGAFILVEGYHRLEALRALGETTVTAYLVNARLK